MADGTLEKSPPRNRGAVKNRKEKRRREMLAKLPKGGRVVEIGVWRGDFSATILEVLEPARLRLIDPWHHIEEPGQENALAARVGRTKMDGIHQAVCDRFAARIDSGQVVVHRGFSGDVVPGLKDRSVDFAYIDGDHSYAGVRADLEMILPKLSPRGVIACDDYHRRGWWKNGVIRAVNEFIGEHARELRVLALDGAQIAIQRLPAMD